MNPSVTCPFFRAFRSPRADVGAVRWAACATCAILIGINASAPAQAKGPPASCDFPTYGTGLQPGSLGAGDLDGDGDLDLTVANSGESNVSVLLNNGNGTFAGDIQHGVGINPVGIVAADLDGDGDLDVAVTNGGSGGGHTLSVLLNNGDGTFATHVQYETGSSPFGIVAADLDADGDLDLAIANISSNAVSVLLNDGNGTFAAQMLTGLGGSGPHIIVAADLDADGDLDLATANVFSNNVSVLLNKGNATFGAHMEHDAGDFAAFIAAADLDADGDVDLAVTNVLGDSVSVLLNTGEGAYAAQVLYGVGIGPNGIAAADFDSDGDLDLATANYTGVDVSVLLNHGDGTFPAEVRICMEQGPIRLTAGDLNVDGSVDLVVANFDSASVSVILEVSALLRGDNPPSGPPSACERCCGKTPPISGFGGHPVLLGTDSGDLVPPLPYPFVLHVFDASLFASQAPGSWAPPRYEHPSWTQDNLGGLQAFQWVDESMSPSAAGTSECFAASGREARRPAPSAPRPRGTSPLPLGTPYPP